MKVLHVYKTYYPNSLGGIEQMIYQLCEGLSKCANNIDSEVLTLSKEDNYTNKVDNHNVHYAKLNFEYASTGISISAIKLFYKLAKQADIIQYHFPWPFADVLHFITLVKKPTILTYHADIIKQKHLLKVYTPLMHAFLRSVDKIVCTSPNYLESSEILQKYKNKVEVIPIGIPENYLDYNLPENLIRKKYWQNFFLYSSQPDLGQSRRINYENNDADRDSNNFNNNASINSSAGNISIQPFFLFVGVLRYYKGLHTLLEAAKNANYKIVIAGSGPLEQELKHKAQSLNLNNIIFLGKISEQDKSILLDLCYAFVFPSHIRTEAFGISLLEAAMHGKAMISCEIGSGMSYINQHNQTGYVIHPQDANALRQAMDNLYNNPKLTSQFAVNAKSRFNNLFKVDKMCNKYMDIYERLNNYKDK